MKICILGAGAIGGTIGVRLAALAGQQVSVLARGETLAAIRRDGWRLQSPDGDWTAQVAATDRAEDLGPQDLVVVAVKGPALAAAAPSLGPLLAPHTVVLPAMNGVPWWFCRDVPGFGDAPLASVDPGGTIGRALPAAQVLGCVVHVSSALAAPGVVRHAVGRGLIVGEPGGGASARAEALAAPLRAAGFEVTVSPDVRRDAWYKLWGNLTMNPISAITGATIDRILADPLVREHCTAVMREAADLGERIGCGIEQTPEDRHAVTAKLGAFRTSMLQDVDAGRALELDAIVGAVVEIGERLGVPMPATRSLFGLARLYGRVHGLYPAEPAAGP